MYQQIRLFLVIKNALLCSDPKYYQQNVLKVSKVKVLLLYQYYHSAEKFPLSVLLYYMM